MDAFSAFIGFLVALGIGGVMVIGFDMGRQSATSDCREFGKVRIERVVHTCSYQ